ncbi:MAG: type II toxin-antitoxin system HicA family toxin [Deltaproteobacteria bacterium]|nr:type II toxin-antitoxin system HicA family toxin [Deltaproteobacteria bacterium]
MTKFPVDAPVQKVISALEQLGFNIIREGNHIAMLRQNPDGTKTPLTMPNHPQIKKSTLRTILTQTGISREDFLKAFGDL